MDQWGPVQPQGFHLRLTKCEELPRIPSPFDEEMDDGFALVMPASGPNGDENGRNENKKRVRFVVHEAGDGEKKGEQSPTGHKQLPDTNCPNSPTALMHEQSRSLSRNGGAGAAAGSVEILNNTSANRSTSMIELSMEKLV